MNPFMKRESSGTDYGVARAGVHDAIFVGIVDVGKQNTNFGVKDKFVLMYELTDDQVQLESGPTNRLWTTSVTQSWNEKSDLSKHLLAIDPVGSNQGDPSKCIGAKVQLVLQPGIPKPDGSEASPTFGSVLQHPKPDTVPSQTLASIVFTPKNPDPEAWKLLRPWIQNLVKKSLDFGTTPWASQVDAVSGGNAATAQAQPVQAAPVAQPQVQAIPQPQPVAPPVQQVATPVQAAPVAQPVAQATPVAGVNPQAPFLS